MGYIFVRSMFKFNLDKYKELKQRGFRLEF